MNAFRIPYDTVVAKMAYWLKFGDEAMDRWQDETLSEGMRELYQEDARKAYARYHALLDVFGAGLDPYEWENLKSAANGRARGVHVVALTVEVPTTYAADRGALVEALRGRRLVWMAHGDDEAFLYDASAVEVQVKRAE